MSQTCQGERKVAEAADCGCRETACKAIESQHPALAGVYFLTLHFVLHPHKHTP